MGLDDLAGSIAGDLLGDLDVDRVKDVVEIVWDNKDDLLELISTLPGLLGEVGEHMQSAGDGAQRASGFLSGDVQDLTAKAADTLVDSQARLQAVAAALGGLGELLDEVPLIGDVGDVVSDGLKALAGVADDVESVAGQIRGLGERLGDVGGDLGGMGTSLKGGGATLAGFSLGKGSGRSRSSGGKTRGASPGGKTAKKKPAAKRA